MTTAQERADERLSTKDAKVSAVTDEGFLRVGNGVMVLVAHTEDAANDVEVKVSDIDDVSYTRGTFGDIGRLSVNVKGKEALVANIPDNKAPAVLKAIYSVEENAPSEKAAARETRAK